MIKDLDIKNWLTQHKQDLLEAAFDGFDNLGRGAVLVNFSHAATTISPPDYISPEQLRQAGYDDHYLYRILKKYDPIREVIIAVLLSDGIKYYRLKAYPWAE